MRLLRQGGGLAVRVGTFMIRAFTNGMILIVRREGWDGTGWNGMEI